MAEVPVFYAVALWWPVCDAVDLLFIVRLSFCIRFPLSLAENGQEFSRHCLEKQKKLEDLPLTIIFLCIVLPTLKGQVFSFKKSLKQGKKILLQTEYYVDRGGHPHSISGADGKLKQVTFRNGKN